MTTEASESGMFPEDENELRLYLLGAITDGSRLEAIETRIMTESEYSETVSMAEDDLIDDYLGGHLPEAEKERFFRHFLITDERREKLRFAKRLRRHAKSLKNAAKEPRAPGFLGVLFASPVFRFASILVLLAGASFLFWRTFVYQSDIDKGLAELRIAYSGRRPIESRTTLDPKYAPFIVTRGDESGASDPGARDRAQLIIAASQKPDDAAARHALGLFYVNERNFEKAIPELVAAEKVDSANVRVLIDLGAAYFESAKLARSASKGSVAIENLGLAMKSFDRAIALKPDSREALFNRALALQFTPLPEQAKQAWRSYLAVDSTSEWADEARRNLAGLEAEPARELSADDLEREFLGAVERVDRDEAWRLLSGNRELVRDKYLPQRLAHSFLKNDGERRDSLMRAMVVAGELENSNNGDPFGSQLASFYSRVDVAGRADLLAAQDAVRLGYKYLGEQEYPSAERSFSFARSAFELHGNDLESALASYLVAYCMINQDRSREAQKVLTETVGFARSRKFRWIEMTALYWVGGSNLKLGAFSEGRRAYVEALKLATELDDHYAIQRNLFGLADVDLTLGRLRPAMDSIDRILVENSRPVASLRQRYRNLGGAYFILERTNLHETAGPIAVESISVADSIGDAMFRSTARINSAMAFAEKGDLFSTERLLNEAEATNDSIGDEITRARLNGTVSLARGAIARRSRNFPTARTAYNRAIEIFERLEMPEFLHEAHKGRLSMLVAAGDREEARKTVSRLIELTEKYRERILEEHQRTSFFDAEQNTYDVIAELEFSSGENEAAYDYVERSNSRSLLDWLHSGSQSSTTQIETAEPLKLSAIRAAMPPGGQILQFAVFEERTLIWLVTQDRALVAEAAVGRQRLHTLVNDYLKALRAPTASVDTDRLGRELYDLLIGPHRASLDPTKPLCIIPNKALFFLPFGALIAPGGERFIGEFAHTYAPGATAFIEFSRRAESLTAVDDESFVAIGNPQFDAGKFESLPDLPAATREVGYAAELYRRNRVLTGASATKPAFRQSLSTADVVHFAGHYVVRHNDPMSSFLLLATDGPDADSSALTNRELAENRLPRTRLVVLSACQTGVEQFLNGEGMIGLSRTFLAAGVPLVVASQWPVDSEATAELMTNFHRLRRKEGLSTVSALRKAQLDMANDPAGRFRSPYYWAAFAVFGGQAKF